VLVDEHDDENVRRVVDRAEAFAQLHVGEASAGAELVRCLRKRRIGDRATHGEPRQCQHVGVGRRVIAVYAHFAERLGRLRQRGDRGGQDDREQDTHGLIFAVTSASR
jgi:hypothetical protein